MISFARAHKENCIFFIIFFMAFLALTDTVYPHVCTSPSFGLNTIIHFYYFINVKYQGFNQVLPLEHFYEINMQLIIKFILNNLAVFIQFSMKLIFFIVYLWLAAAAKLVGRRAVKRPHRR